MMVVWATLLVRHCYMYIYSTKVKLIVSIGIEAGLIDPEVPEKGMIEDSSNFSTTPVMSNTGTESATSAAAAPPTAPIEKLEYASQCFLPTTFIPLPLVEKIPVNHDTYIFGFGLPTEGTSLNLPTCACLLMIFRFLIGIPLF